MWAMFSKFPSSSEVKNGGAIPSSPYIFMELGLIKCRNNFLLTQRKKVIKYFLHFYYPNKFLRSTK
jgi:hypothetical protein